MSDLFAVMKPRGVAHEPAAPVLEVKNVSVVYAAGTSSGVTLRAGLQSQDEFALEGISFDVNTGQCVAVVGPNGAGKSTLFKLIVGTIRPSQGFVHVYGHGPAGHTCIAYVPQRNQIDWSFPVTVNDVVMMGRVGQMGMLRWPRPRDWQIVRDCLARVGASDLISKQIGELSGGQQQRVFIARALAQEAELLLMDEPLSGLDTPSREALFQILEGLRLDGVTILLATHDLNLAAERFDHILLLNRHIVALGPPATVLSSGNLLKAYGGHQETGSESNG
jgi:ABC-type Mn2+/Zn2+ transport system ATPase subunit